MDREEAGAEGERDQNEGDDTRQIEIPWLWILERQRGMESQTSPRFSGEIQKVVKATNQKKLVSGYDLPYPEVELGDSGMDKLFSNRKHENSADQD